MFQRHTHPVDFDALFERLAKLADAFEGVRTLGLEPHALHLVQVFHSRDALSCELLTHGLGGGNHVGSEHVFGALAINVPGTHKKINEFFFLGPIVLRHYCPEIERSSKKYIAYSRIF